MYTSQSHKMGQIPEQKLFSNFKTFQTLNTLQLVRGHILKLNNHHTLMIFIHLLSKRFFFYLLFSLIFFIVSFEKI